MCSHESDYTAPSPMPPSFARFVPTVGRTLFFNLPEPFIAASRWFCRFGAGESDIQKLFLFRLHHANRYVLDFCKRLFRDQTVPETPAMLHLRVTQRVAEKKVETAQIIRHG